MKKNKQTTLLDFVKKEFSKSKGLYELPHNWRWAKLGELFSIQQGKSLSPKSRRGISPYPFLRTVNIKWGYVDLSTIDYMDFNEKEIKKLSLEPGDLLVCEGGEVGRTAIWRGELPNCSYQNHIHRLRKKMENILPEFVMYWMMYAAKVLNVFYDKSSNTTISNLSAKRLSSLKIPLPFKDDKPDIEEQKRIVSRIEELFSRIDRIKELRKQAKEEAETLLKAALHKVFSKADEKGWRWMKLGEIANISAGGTPSRSVKDYWENGTIPWVKISDIPEDGLVRQTEEKITLKGLNNSSAKIFPKGSLLFTIFATIGKVGILEIDAATNQAIAGIQIKRSSNVFNKYLFYNLKYFGYILEEKSRGAAQNNVNQTILKALKIPLPFKNGKPDIEEQKRIADYFDRIAIKQRKLIELYEKTEKELELMKQSILNKAFRGQL